MDLIKDIEMLLEKEKILPVTQDNWFSFNINHIPPLNSDEMEEKCKMIKSYVGNKAGIYIYKKDDIILYIGKSGRLYDRMKSHYIESFSTVRGDTETQRWHRFFSLNQENLTVLWKEVDTEIERQLIKLVLTNKLNPVFNSFK